MFTQSPRSATVPSKLAALLLATGAIAAQAASAAETASTAVDFELKVVSDQRTRGISDSLNRPGAKAGLQAAHQSGLIGSVEVATVSKKQFLDGNGLGVTLATGYRLGDPEGWHFGVGAATEIFPGAKFTAPHALEPVIDPNFGLVGFMPADLRTTKYDSQFVGVEIGWGPIEARVVNVISKTYRGANTGGVCGTLLEHGVRNMADPTDLAPLQPAIDCYSRGDKNSRGSWLFDLDFKHEIARATTLRLHVGHQKIANFSEADVTDYGVGITYKLAGFDLSADWIGTDAKTPALFLVQDGNKLRATDKDSFVVSVGRRF
jgi:hypothetical protein